MGSDSISGVMWSGCGITHPPSSNTKVKERVDLHLYSPSMLSRQVIQWPLLFNLLYRQVTFWGSISVTNVLSRLAVHIKVRHGNQLKSWFITSWTY
jgi:hypothetical protein